MTLKKSKLPKFPLIFVYLPISELTTNQEFFEIRANSSLVSLEKSSLVCCPEL